MNGLQKRKLGRTSHWSSVITFGALDERDGLNKALGLGGAIETFLEAKEEGVIRDIGISADSGARLHKNEMDLVVRKEVCLNSVEYHSLYI